MHGTPVQCGSTVDADDGMVAVLLGVRFRLSLGGVGVA